MNADTFWTQEYKGHWIHGHCDRDLKQEIIRIQCPNGVNYPAKSLHSAKYKISAFLRGNREKAA